MLLQCRCLHHQVVLISSRLCHCSIFYLDTAHWLAYLCELPMIKVVMLADCLPLKIESFSQLLDFTDSSAAPKLLLSCS